MGFKVIVNSDQEPEESLSPEYQSLRSLQWQRVNFGGVFPSGGLQRISEQGRQRQFTQVLLCGHKSPGAVI